MSITNALKTLPDFWKTAAVAAAFVAMGASGGVFFSSLWSLPDTTVENRAMIEENRLAISNVSTEMARLRFEIRVANCLDLQEKNQDLNFRDCVGASVRDFMNLGTQ